jgi:hypothetical protein
MLGAALNINTQVPMVIDVLKTKCGWWMRCIQGADVIWCLAFVQSFDT